MAKAPKEPKLVKMVYNGKVAVVSPDTVPAMEERGWRVANTLPAPKPESAKIEGTPADE